MTDRQRDPEHERRPRPDPAHAPGKAHRGAPPAAKQRAEANPAAPAHDQPWVPTSGLVGRSRRSARRG